MVLWTANTERFSALEVGINDTKGNILASISRGEEEVRFFSFFFCSGVCVRERVYCCMYTCG